MSLCDLTDKKIIITGASSGIGRASAVLASKLGARVVLCGRDEKRISETSSMLEGSGHSTFLFDIADFEIYPSIFDKIVLDGKKLDGMLHCAGIAEAVPMRIMKYEQIKKIMDINFASFILLTAIYSKKKYSDGGSIVGISAVNAHYPQKCMSIYAASKAAIEASVRTAALELADKQIRINCVTPGVVDTPMGNNSANIKEIARNQLLGISKAEDIAKIAIFLLSDASSVITGRAIYADGGMLGQSI